MKLEKFLVVVDPTHSEHLALNRIVNFASRKRHSDMCAHVFVGFEGEDLSEPDQPKDIVRGRDWLGELLLPLENTGIKFTVEQFWAQDWENSIINAARRTQADVIVIPQSSATKSTSIMASIWSLLRNSVLLHGQMVAEFYDAKLHVVNAYHDNEDYPDRDKVKRIIDIDRRDIHVDMGTPEEIIAKLTNQLQADLVIIGTMARRGIRAALRKNTVERIIKKLTVDVLTLNRLT